MTPLAAKQHAGAPRYYCGECDREETDPIFLDVETCGECGELISASGDDDDSQPDEQQEWMDYDGEC